MYVHPNLRQTFFKCYFLLSSLLFFALQLSVILTLSLSLSSLQIQSTKQGALVLSKSPLLQYVLQLSKNHMQIYRTRFLYILAQLIGPVVFFSLSIFSIYINAKQRVHVTVNQTVKSEKTSRYCWNIIIIQLCYLQFYHKISI